MAVPGVPSDKLKRMAVRAEVAIIAALIGLTGGALLIAAAVVYISERSTLVAGLALVGMGLILLAGIAILLQALWAILHQRRAEVEQPPEEDENPLERILDIATSGPLGMASSALMARQARKSPVATAAGLAAIGLLMFTRDRRKAPPPPREPR